MGLLARFDALDRSLVAHGFPRTSPWWRRELERFLKSGKRRWVLRVGRRGGKSSTICRLMVVVAMCGEWYVPPGDIATIAVVSVDRLEASKRIHTVRAILDAMGVRYEQRGQEVFIPERNCSITVKTCSLTGTVGFTSVMIFADEMAKWSVVETGANPAKEVMASLRPSMATQPTAFEVDCSAPWGDDDLHYELMAQGDTEHQVTGQAATWEANPTITVEQTRELEPDEKEWSRAYAAIPGIAVNADWFGLALDRAMAGPRCTEPHLPWVRYLLSIDPAFSRDHFGWAVISSRTLPPDPRQPDRSRRMTRIHAAGAWKIGQQTPTDLAFRVRNELCVPWGVGLLDLGTSESPESKVLPVYTDQFEGFSFTDLARQAGVALHVVPWTGGNGETSQLARYKAVRLAMLEGRLELPSELHAADGIRKDGLASELKRVSSVLLPGGGERIVLPRSKKDGHLDSVAATVLGVSVALDRAAQPELELPGDVKVEQPWRAAEIKRIEDQRRKEWRRPDEAMRAAMRRLG